jgi:hypothetical protein
MLESGLSPPRRSAERAGERRDPSRCLDEPAAATPTSPKRSRLAESAGADLNRPAERAKQAYCTARSVSGLAQRLRQD